MSEITKFSNSINTKDEEFNKLLKLAVQADVENTLFLFNRLPRTTHPDPSDVPSIYEELFTDGIKFSDPNILRLENGVSWMENYFFYYSFHGKYSRSNVQGLKDYLSHISDDRVKEVLVRETVKRGKLKPFEYDKIMEFSREYMVSETSKNFLLEYEKDLHSEAGQSGFNFSYEDIDGKMVSFSDFRGKYVYIDLWATWCGPCKKQIPYLKELEEEYADDNIEFLSISLDKPADKEKWKKFVKDNNLTGVQLVADKAFESAVAINYSINAIPRFLLFDTEGKIISSDAIRPSNPELKSQLDSILKK
ncbi:TlpA family protein disulfide reductase [Joostella sp. CR20]